MAISAISSWKTGSCIVRSVFDIHRGKREGKLGIIFGTQGIAAKIEGATSLMLILQRVGQRIVQVCYNERDAVGCGCMEVSDTGLTQFGYACIREMNILALSSPTCRLRPCG